MLNKNSERELAYIVKIDNITTIEGYDRVELAHVGGWTIVVGKDQFKINDLAIYFEIDSKLPEVEPFINNEFLAKKHFKIKTQKMCKSLSQGLLMHPRDFGWMYNVAESNKDCIVDETNTVHYLNDESRFLTKKLNITYSVEEDNHRKAKNVDKYKSMINRHYKLFRNPFLKWLVGKKLGKKILFVFLGKKSDSKRYWPEWVSKTDEERIENLPFLFKNKELWIATEKIDGSSTTFTMKREKLGQYKFIVCSRNVAFINGNDKCFYETNVYTEMAKKYSIEKVLKNILDKHKEYEWVTIQGETYGEGIQKHDYSLGSIHNKNNEISNHDFAAFNFITSTDGRWSSVKAAEYLNKFNIPWVPILDEYYSLPDTLEELRIYVDSETSKIDGSMREGIVFRSLDGIKSFKCVSPEYLIKYHE